MATAQGPLPPPSTPWIDVNDLYGEKGRRPGMPSLSFRQYFLSLDSVVRFLIGFMSGTNTASPPLIAVAAPSNANAAAAGVGLGQLYRDTADPCKVYIRTV